MIDVKGATHVIYKPENTKYRILCHDIMIKDQFGGWSVGCSYIGKDQQMYVRPYSMFSGNSWEVLDED